MLINLRIITNIMFSLVFACASSALAEEKAPGKELSPCAFLDESLRIFKFIVDDVEKNYDHLGGPMSAIELVETNVYKVTLLQEERVDFYTYYFESDKNCKLSIKRKEYSVWTPGDGGKDGN